jgi:outer membrane protein OmpA-like peptidoglycan-associated protein
MKSKHCMVVAAALSLAALAQAQILSPQEITARLKATPAAAQEDDDDLGMKAVRPDPITKLCEPRPAAMARNDNEFRNLVVEPAPSVNLTVEFDFGRATLRPEGAAQLDSLATALKGESLAKNQFTVSGHTDAVGARDANDKLSCDRALAAKAYLVERGVSPLRLVAMGFGASRLLVPSDPRAASNRRVEIKVVPQK